MNKNQRGFAHIRAYDLRLSHGRFPNATVDHYPDYSEASQRLVTLYG